MGDQLGFCEEKIPDMGNSSKKKRKKKKSYVTSGGRPELTWKKKSA